MNPTLVCALSLLLADPKLGPVDDDVQDLVILGADKPAFLRLHIQLDGVGFRKLQPQLAEQLFQTFDRNQDGQWDKAEQADAQKSGKLAILGKDAAFDPKALDKNQDGLLSQSEFISHALPALGPPCVVRSDSQNMTRLVPLFQKVDADEDGRLSLPELQNLSSAVRKLDLDDDEILSLAELAPPPENGPAPVPMAGVVDSPLLLLSAETRADVARSLLKRYSKRGSLPVSLFNLSPEAVAMIDADRNGALSREELLKLLTDPPPGNEVLVKLPRTRERYINIQPLSALSTTGKTAPRTRSISAQVLLAGMATEIKGATVVQDVADNRAYYRQQFLRADADKNKYLNEGEFPALGLEGSFAQLDRNGDGMLVQEEMLEYLTTADQLDQSRIELLIANDNKSLFELLDLNYDLRISPREFSAAAVTLHSRDVNTDGLIDSAELGNKYRMTVSLNKPKLFQPTGMSAMPPMNGRRAPRVETSAPSWFSRMDRNGDGDVSRREFSGPLSAFDQLDADKNGVLDPAEAAAAK